MHKTKGAGGRERFGDGSNLFPPRSWHFWNVSSSGYSLFIVFSACAIDVLGEDDNNDNISSIRRLGVDERIRETHLFAGDQCPEQHICVKSASSVADPVSGTR